MNDKELLMMAAKAAGVKWVHDGGISYYTADYMPSSESWDPLTDDGDALRLSVKLDMQVTVDLKGGESWIQHDQIKGLIVEEYNGSCEYAATRRAIVRAAAEIGRKL